MSWTQELDPKLYEDIRGNNVQAMDSFTST